MPTYVTRGDAIGGLPAIGQGETAVDWDTRPPAPYQRKMREGSTQLYNHEARKHRAETAAYYGFVPPGGTALDIPIEVRKAKQGIQRWPLDGLARTITTEPTDFLHPTLNRIPTVRELARIQSFPTASIFSASASLVTRCGDWDTARRRRRTRRALP